MQHDGTIDIAVGKSRKEVFWRNTQTTWSKIVERLSHTQYTHETMTEFLKMPRSRQDEIKDVGGFVGGYINGGKRRIENITHRSLITLDLDFATPDVWDNFTLLYGNAAAMYSTHKHTPDKPRLRLVMPLSRVVFADEYEAVTRRVAEQIGIDMFDETTFEPGRLMYYPSTSRNSEFYYKVQDGPWLDPDQVLASYKNWRDTSEWATNAKYVKDLEREAMKQGDPREKQGLVGAFCRVYGIHDAISAFLPTIYKQNDKSRYTYTQGSTSGGLVIYKDVFAYSHHSTDPVRGKLCNAFDLVRLHLFGLADEDAKEGTPVTKLQSYKLMIDRAAEDKEVKKLVALDKIKSASDDFKGIDSADADFADTAEETDNEWLGELEIDRRGVPMPTIDNALLIIENDERLKNAFALNKFDVRETAKRPLPWRDVKRESPLKDSDDAALRHYIEKKYNLKSKASVQDAMMIVVERHAYHPVKEYLEGLTWDKTERLDSLLIDYLGAENTEYVKAITSKTLIAAVKRIYEPGAKFDNVLTLVGKQGIGKSTIVKRLGMQWYSDSFGTIQGKEAYESIQGVWLMELGELAGLKKAEFNTVKHFISKCEDRYRVAYGRRTEEFPRQCVFIGTTNDNDFLQDPTGNRRFWIVDLLKNEPSKNIWEQLTKREVGQIWAEAVFRYKKKEPIYLSKKVEEEALLKQEEHTETDEKTELIQKFLDTQITENWEDLTLSEKRAYLQKDPLSPKGDTARKRITVLEIWTELYGQRPSELDRYRAKEIHNSMKKVKGWEQKLIRKNGVITRGYAPTKKQSK